MKFPSRQIVEKLRAEYPAGTRVELVKMDDIGSIMVAWDNGSSLHIVYGEDVCKKI